MIIEIVFIFLCVISIIPVFFIIRKTIINKRKSNFIDANDFVRDQFKPIVYVGPDGKIYFHCHNFSGEIIGIGEWDQVARKSFNVVGKMPVLDLKIISIEIEE